ncbi:MAG: FecR domain-containing protein, partial [Odoribacter sp.]
NMDESDLSASDKGQAEDTLDTLKDVLESLTSKDFTYLNRLESIKQQQDWRDVEKRVHLRRRIFLFRKMLAYASVFFIALGLSLFFFFYQEKNENKPEQQFIAQDIRQIRQQAQLELSDGRMVAIGNKPLNIKEQDGVSISSDTSGNLVYGSHNMQSVQQNYNSLYVPRAGEYTLLLSDGTKVYLNSDTKFRYPTTFSGNFREVWLEGEAFFQVAKDQTKPFIVNTQNMRAEVLGTSFNFSAYSENTEIQLTLLTGSVKVHCDCANRDLIIKPNTQVALNKETKTLQEYNVDAHLYALWTEGVFHFRDATVEEIAATISRCYDVKIKFTSEGIKSLKFYGQIDRYATIDNVIDIINQTKKVWCEKVGDDLVQISIYKE